MPAGDGWIPRANARDRDTKGSLRRAHPNQVQRATANGKVFYVYKDEAAGVAYVGGEAEYQNYKRLAIEQHIAHERYMVYEMERQAAYRWYGGWGPHGMWW